MKDLTDIVVAVLLLVSVTHRGDAAVPGCPSWDTVLCYDCLSTGDCSKTNTAGEKASIGTVCPAGEACTIINGVALCRPTATVTGCDCGGNVAGCDTYNTDQSIFCIPEGAGHSLYLGTDCSASNQICLKSECVDPPVPINPCAGQATAGFVIETPTCTSAVFCIGGVYKYTYKCLDGEYFNTARSDCEPFPPNPCTGCSDVQCPIFSNCSKFAICVNGQAQEPDESCPAGEYFNPESKLCVAERTGVCVDYVNCKFELATTTASTTTVSDSLTSTSTSTPVLTSTPTPTTTNTPTLTPTPTPTTTNTPTLTPNPTLTSSPTPTTTATLPTTPSPIITSTAKPSTCTAANADIRYPDETECKSYWTCRLITASSYGYVKSSCPGAYVFNPTSKYCDLASNVLDCNV